MTILSTKVLKILKSVRIYQRERFKISRMQDALTKKDSALAVVTSLKSAVGILTRYRNKCRKRSLYQSLINYYSKAEVMKLLTAKGVLAKVAKVVNDKPDFECMVEGT
jgi:chemotaxis protein MotB